MKNKILAVVKFNDGEGYVLKKPIKLIYTKIGSDAIVGTDGVFYTFYFLEQPWGRFEAFAGRKFDITLDTGEIIHCKGQWWDGFNKTSREYAEKNNIEIVHVTANCIKKLKQCYVYYGYQGDKKTIAKLRSKYKGKVYAYHEYDYILKEGRVKA